MSWKKFIRLDTQKYDYDESNFIIGLDFGNSTSAIAYFDPKRKKAELVDLSGGYGKCSIPSVIQYIPESREWVFGEYALLNNDVENTVTINDLIDRIGKVEYVEIDNKLVSIVNVFSLIIKEIISNIKNINPRSIIAGIVCCIPKYINEDTRQELISAFNVAGYSKELIGLYSDIECLLANEYLYNENTEERVLVLDFGNSGLRGGVYDINIKNTDILVKSLSTYFEPALGTKEIDTLILKLFYQYYEIKTNIKFENFSTQIKSQLWKFMYQHKDILLNTNIINKPIRIYFNFAHTPFQFNISKEEMQQFIEPLISGFKYYVNKILERNIYDGRPILKQTINKVICSGGGFEMFWVKKLVSEIFIHSKIVADKNTKGILAKGASIIAASKLKLIQNLNFNIIDKQQLDYDLGIIVRKNYRRSFVPIIEKNTFWWQYTKPTYVLINNDFNKPVSIDIYKRNSVGDLSLLCNIPLPELMNIQNKVTKLSISLEYINFEEIVATFIDCGFGELFKSSGFNRAVILKI